MNRLEYYDRQKEPWEPKEVTDLVDEYERRQMTVSQIADIHRRTPGSISSKLKNLGLVSNMFSARGYGEYKASDLYKEVVQTNKENKARSKQDSLGQMEDLKKEIAKIRKDVK